MNPESLFSLASTLVLPGWLLLVIFPRWEWTTRLITTVLIPGLLAVLYTYLLVTTMGEGEGGFGSLADVGLLFQHLEMLLAGWIHYLAFDLLVGSWMVRDAKRRGVRHLLVVPCLVLCFLAGPVGYLLYLLARAATTRQILMEAETA